MTTEKDREYLVRRLNNAVWLKKEEKNEEALEMIKELQKTWPEKTAEDLFRYDSGCHALCYAAAVGNTVMMLAIHETGCDVNLRHTVRKICRKNS